MSIIEYNLRLIIVFAIATLGAIFLPFEIINEGKELGWFKNNFQVFKYSCIIIGFIMACGMIYLTLSSFAFEESEKQDLQIVEINEYGSFGGLSDTYKISLKDKNNDIIEVQTVFMSSHKLRNIIEELKIGDIVMIKYVEGINNLYYIKKG